MNTVEVDATCGSKVVHESSNGAKVSQDEAERTEVSQDTANESKVSQDDTDRKKDDTAGSDGAACCDKEEVVDPYSYLERDGFTSEIFKIEVYNLPKKFGISVSVFINGLTVFRIIDMFYQFYPHVYIIIGIQINILNIQFFMLRKLV